MKGFADALSSDFRFALRVLRRSPWGMASVVSVLALALGAAITILGAVRGVLLRPLPFENPSALVSVGLRDGTRGAHSGISVSEFVEWRAAARSFTDLAGFRIWGFELEGSAEPERVAGARVTPNLFAVLGARPITGRTLMAPDETADVAVLSDSLWRAAFGADPQVIGRVIRLNGRPHVVVGVVATADMHPAAALWVPYVFAPYEREQRGDRALSVIARLRNGVSVELARAELEAVARIAAQGHAAESRGWTPEIVPLRDALIGNTRTVLFVLLIATLGLVLIGCASVANALLARLLDRRSELATRAAIGATGGRLVQQIVTESVVVVALGGIGALGIGLAATRWLSTLGAEYLPRSAEVKFDALVFALAAVVLAIVAMILGGVVAVSFRRLDVAAATRSRPGARRDPSRTLRDGLAIGQLALTVVLLADGLLLTASLRRLQAIDLGFDPTDVAAMAISLPGDRYNTLERRVAFFDQVLQSFSRSSGVRGAAITSRVPFTASATGGIINTIESGDGSTAPPRGAVTLVSPEYFTTLRMPLVAGRLFSTRDRAGAPRVAVVDEALARQLSPNGSVVGRHVRLGGGTGADTTTLEIVGVVASARIANPALPPDATIYLPYSQIAWPSMSVVVRGDEQRASNIFRMLRRAVRSVDPTRPVYNARLVRRSLDTALATRRLQSVLVTGFAIVAFVIALLGIYALFNHAVRQRDRELGIRLALGAAPQDVVTLVLREAFVRVASGISLGVIVALALGGLIRSSLFGITPWNLGIMTAAATLPAIGALLASYLPARRAGRVPPMAALRTD